MPLAKQSPNTWSTAQVASWLESNQLGHLKSIFVDNKIAGGDLMDLTKPDLKDELNIGALGDRKALWQKIEELKAGGGGAVPESKPTPKAAVKIDIEPPAQLVSGKLTSSPPSRYQSEYQSRFGGKNGSPIPSPRRLEPTVTVVTKITGSCEFCYKKFQPADRAIQFTLPGEKRGVMLHPDCKEDWISENARPCGHCKGYMANNIVAVALPGQKVRTEMHIECKNDWIQRNADRCTQCEEPLINECVRLTGPHGEAMLHENCCDIFEKNLQKEMSKKSKEREVKPSTGFNPSPRRSPRGSTPLASSKGVKCAECGTSTSEPMVTTSGNWGMVNVHTKCQARFEKKHSRDTGCGTTGLGRCEHCLQRFKADDSPVMVKEPKGTRLVHVHSSCKNRMEAKAPGPRCEECGKLLGDTVVKITGSFGNAEVHPECSKNYERRVQLNKGKKPPSRASTSPRVSPR